MDLSIPALFYANHSYWWDGFWALLCTQKYFRQNLYIIIEDKQLVRYQFFTRLGAFSIDRSNARSAIESINYAAEVLTTPPLAGSSKHKPKQNALWLFPQGAIEHIDKRPLHFFNGAGTIVQKVLERQAASGKRAAMYLIPLATRIDYFGEQKPELWLSFKPPILMTRDNFSTAKALTASMQRETETHLDELKARILTRNSEGSDVLVAGKASVNRWWDEFRAKLGLAPKAK